MGLCQLASSCLPVQYGEKRKDEIDCVGPLGIRRLKHMPRENIREFKYIAHSRALSSVCLLKQSAAVRLLDRPNCETPAGSAFHYIFSGGLNKYCMLSLVHVKLPSNVYMKEVLNRRADRNRFCARQVLPDSHPHMDGHPEHCPFAFVFFSYQFFPIWPLLTETETMMLFTSATFSFGGQRLGCYVKNKQKVTSVLTSVGSPQCLARSALVPTSEKPGALTRKHQQSAPWRFIFLIHFSAFFAIATPNSSSQETDFGNLGCVQLTFVIAA